MENIDLLTLIQKCPECNGLGKILQNKKITNCHCVGKALLDYRLSVSNLPPRLAKFNFKDYLFKSRETFKKVQKYILEAPKAVEKGIGLYLYGSENDCNTLSVGVLKELIKLGYTSYYTPYASCLSTDQNPSLTEDDFVFVCISNITSVLDNLVNFKPTILTGSSTNYAVSYLEQVISMRASKNLPTILTGSVGFPKLIEKFPNLGALLYGNFLSVECVETDFRNTGAYEKLQKEFGFDEIQ